MNIIYNNTKKDLPPEQVHKLFIAVGWSDGGEPPDMIMKGYSVPWINSTLVISAWDDKRLVGVVRVLSDTMFRSVIYDLIVLPEYQNNGIGRELVKRCIEHYPNSEWLVGTMKPIAPFYEKIGFVKTEGSDGVYLSLPCKYFTI